MSELVSETDVEILEPEPEPEPVEQPTFSAADDPRAMAAIRRAKGFGGLAGFVLTGLAAHMHGELAASVLLRALAGGLAGYMIAWLAAVTVWRRIIRAELQQTIETMAKGRGAPVRSDVQ
jgi:hypothetical protein